MKKLLLLLLLVGCREKQKESDTTTFTATGGFTAVYPTPSNWVSTPKDWDAQADTELQGNYYLFNTKYFDGQLPSDAIVEVSPKVAKSLDDIAVTLTTPDGKMMILVDDKYADADRIYLPTLLHEMCHVETWSKVDPIDPHGPLFQDCIQRLLLAGAYKDLL